MRAAYPGRRLLIVSNTAGARSYDTKGDLAAALEKATGLHVLSHQTKKPGCTSEVMEYFRKHPEAGVTSPSQIAVVGDRLSTDMMLANTMGSYAIWVKDGVVPLQQKSIVSERLLSGLAWLLTLTPCPSSLDWSRKSDRSFLLEVMSLRNLKAPSSNSVRGET